MTSIYLQRQLDGGGGGGGGSSKYIHGIFPAFCCQVKILMIKNNRPSMSGLKSTSSIVLQNFWRFFHIFWGLDYMS